MPTSTLTSKGQTTIPKQIRDFLQLKTGDRLEFIIEGEGQVLLRPATSELSELDGLLARPERKPVSVAAMEEAVAREVSRPFRRKE